jgi:hypothetical protein
MCLVVLQHGGSGEHSSGTRVVEQGFLDEIEVLPLCKHDDQVDAAVGAFEKLTLHKPAKFRMWLGPEDTAGRHMWM